MKCIRRTLALLAALLLLALAGCGGEGQTTEQTPQPPDPTVADGQEESQPPSQSPSPQPTETQPQESLEPEPEGEPSRQRPYEEEGVLEVDGTEQPARRWYSGLGYSMTYLPDKVNVNAWDGGETYELIDAQGSYIGVTTVAASNIGEAVAGLQFEYAIEADPVGVIFGAEGYAGVRMSIAVGGLEADYILFQNGDGVIYLVEVARFTGGERYSALLQAMLDSFTIG